MKEKLVIIVKVALDLEDAKINLNDHFNSFDTWDSIGRLSLIALIDEEFNIQLSDDEFSSLDTLQDLYDAIRAKKS